MGKEFKFDAPQNRGFGPFSVYHPISELNEFHVKHLNLFQSQPAVLIPKFENDQMREGHSHTYKQVLILILYSTTVSSLPQKTNLISGKDNFVISRLAKTEMETAQTVGCP